jgi:hypothetical protein
MSFENTPEQVATPEVDVPVKKRGRPAGAKNKEPVAKKTVAKKTTANPLASKLHHANLYIVTLEEEHKKLRQRYKTEVDGLMAIVSYLEATLKETWQKDAIDAASI